MSAANNSFKDCNGLLLFVSQIFHWIIFLEMLLGFIPASFVNDSLVFTFVNLTFIIDFPDIGMILQNPVNMTYIPGPAITSRYARFLQFKSYLSRRSDLQETRKDPFYNFDFFFVYM